jgi:acetyl esterase/lipase
MSSPFDSSAPSSPRPARRAGRARAFSIVGRGFASILVVITALLVVGTFIPGAPWIGLSSGIVSIAPAWFIVLSLVGAGAAWFAWRKLPTRIGTAMVVTGVVAAMGAGLITGRMIHSVQHAGAHIHASTLLKTVPIVGDVVPDDRPVYLTRDGQSLRINVYRPSRRSKPAPILVYIHGGGWTKGTAGQRGADMQWFADQGFLVLSVGYTLSTSTTHLWDVTQGQIGCSLSWVAKNASKYGGDPGRLSLTGESSGGTMAINTAYLQSAGKLPSACGGTAPKVAAISVTYPGTDLVSIHDASPPGANYTESYTGGTPEQFPKRYSAGGSFNKITKGAPPTLILMGESDHVVPAKDTARFAARTRDAGIETKLVQVPYADHGFDAVDANIGDQAYRQLTLNWLIKHGQKP